jgi:hypothetical protein
MGWLIVGVMIYAGIGRVIEEYTPLYAHRLHRRCRKQARAWGFMIKARLKITARFIESQFYAINLKRRAIPLDDQRRVRKKGPRRNLPRSFRLSVVLALYTTDKSSTQTLRVHQSRFDSDSVPLKVDNCSSRTMSFDKNDFIGPLTPIKNAYVRGIGGKLQGVNLGTIRWCIEDDQGARHDIELPDSFYVPGLHSRLLCPQHWAQVAMDNYPKKDGTKCTTYADRIVMKWQQRQITRTVWLDTGSTNTGTIYTAPGFSKYKAFCTEISDTYDEDPIAYDSYMIMSDEDDPEPTVQGTVAVESHDSEGVLDWNPTQLDFDLDGPEESRHPPDPIEPESEISNPSSLMLKWHQRLGHISMKKLQLMAQQGLLPAKIKNCAIPICTSCLYGKATRRQWRTSAPLNARPIRKALQPGECISVDQLESTTPGLIAQSRGRPTTRRYKAATVFVDNYSRLSYVHLQQSLSAQDTLEAKRTFERFAATHGVTVRHYHADNGRFADNLFRRSVNEQGQGISFCGVNAHHQNGIAERRIRELQEQTRTILIHANRRWPDAISAHLWPYAIRMANELFNNSPTITGDNHQTPIERFSRSTVMPNIKQILPFGCPAYVLNNALQARQKIGKWEERARIGVHLGLSPNHARTVGLILNLSTGLVSPQFHVKYDPTFQTVMNPDEPIPKSQWQHLCGFTRPPPSTTSDQLTEVAVKNPVAQAPTLLPTTVLASDMSSEGAQASVPSYTPLIQYEEPAMEHATTEHSSVDSTAPIDIVLGIDNTVRRSQRQTKPNPRYFNDDILAYETLSTYHLDEEDWDTHPMLAYAASADPDIMYYHQAIKEPDGPQFVKAMVEEVTDHLLKGHFEVCERSEVPEGVPVLPSVWAMRRKRRIDTREVYKWKARLNLDGSKQIKGLNYWETYAPVATWGSIRLVLVITLVHKWKTRQIDFVQAYTQADPEIPNMYMELPKGFVVDNDDSTNKRYVLRLKKNLYGQKQAGRVWNQHLVNKLLSIGFIQTEADECVFIRHQVLFVLYTDDSILTAETDNELDEAIQVMKEAGLEITVEGGISDFLGVRIQRMDNDTFELTQPHLIEQILSDLRLTTDNVATKDTPAASSRLLRRHLEEPAFDGHFDYRSVIGKLNYLEKSTRPDISFAVHQCARFCADPRDSHGKAVKWLGRYLKATKDRGIRFKPNRDTFDCYVDADFSGNWYPDDAAWDVDTARSRTGFVILYAGCPILWTSKLQSEIALGRVHCPQPSST